MTVQSDVHKPFPDDGVTYCGWGTDSGVFEGCGEVWPCSTVREAMPPDPRTVALIAVRNMAFDWYCPFDERRPRVDCRDCIAEVVLDAYEAAARLDHGITS